MRYICTSIVAMLALVGTSFAATINVPGDQPTIAAAISASSDGDVIAIAAGTYYEANLSPGGKAITIQGTLNGDGTLATTIDAQQAGSVIKMNSYESIGTVIKDLKITGGDANRGGGIYCSFSNPTITDCEIASNTANEWGGGIYCAGSSPAITGCKIEGNTAPKGGGIFCTFNSNPTITGCTIQGNTTYVYGGGIYGQTDSYPIISGGSVCGNSPDQTYTDSSSDVTSGLCWIAASCDGNPYIVIANQQEQINQLLTMHDQQQSQIDTQQSAIEDLQQVIEACCVERTCTGDENKDGVVNIEDLLIVISVWGPCP